MEWNDAGLNGVVKFLHRVWRLVLQPESIEVTAGARDGGDAVLLRRRVAQTIKKVTDDYEDLRFNTAVAYLMELANTMQDYLQGGGVRDEGWDAAVHTLVKLLNPIGPHISEEMWERLGEGGPDRGLLADATWPEFDAAVAAEPEVTLVVQVSGKVRDRMAVAAGLSEDQALAIAMASDRVRAALNGSKPSKVIYVRDKLINLVP